MQRPLRNPNSQHFFSLVQMLFGPVPARNQCCWKPSMFIAERMVLNTVKQPRRVNNHNERTAAGLQKLADAVSFSYGRQYQKSIDYLVALAANRFWQEASLAPLPWHSAPANAAPPGPPLVIHQSVLDALAPSVPLRAVFSRQ